MALRRMPRERGSRLHARANTTRAEVARERAEAARERHELSRIKAEQRAALARLTEREAVFAQIFQQMPNPLAIARTADATIYEVNEALVGVSGFSREEILGRRSIEFAWWPTPEEGEALLGKMAEQGFLSDVEMRILDREGGEHFCLVSANPITMHGEPCVVWHAVEITERKRADELRRKLEARLAEKQNLERLGTVAGAIAHDFNNLLVSVLGNADLLLLQLPDQSPLRALVQSIVTSAQRAADHTRELLDYAGRGGGKLRAIRLDTLLGEIATLAEPLVGKAARIEYQNRASGQTWIQGDVGQLTRMFLNLVKNAADALEGRPGKIELVLDEADDGPLRVTVRDQGRGMSDGTSKRMFDPFFSTKVEGRGLGLISVPGIVERHMGAVAVTSQEGVGTTIVVTLPACAPPESGRRAPSEPTRPLGKGLVLVVDDEPEVRSIANVLLGELGYDVVEAEHGARALELLSTGEHGFSWVLLDATMPGLDGTQVLARLRALEPTLPVLLCSGYSRTDFTELFAQQAHLSFLTKPYRLSELAAAIDGLLGEAEAQGSRAAS